jgi:hypothetical protein
LITSDMGCSEGIHVVSLAGIEAQLSAPMPSPSPSPSPSPTPTAPLNK